MLRKLVSSTEDDVKINLSPMIDMVFILLIFFIVTTVFVEEIGVTVSTSDAGESLLNDKPPVTISINTDQISINSAPVQKSSFLNRIKIEARDPEAKFIVTTSDGLKHELFSDIWTKCLEAGIEDRLILKQY